MATPISHNYIGSVLYQLVSASPDIKVNIFPTSSNNSFIINEKIAIYVKYSQKTVSPWQFTFKKINQEELKIISEMYKHTYLILICALDGIVSISYKDLKYLLDENYEDAEWIRLSRIGAKRYTVTGKNGLLPYKLTNKSFPGDIISILKL
jgi:hypothetical protein